LLPLHQQIEDSVYEKLSEEEEQIKQQLILLHLQERQGKEDEDGKSLQLPPSVPIMKVFLNLPEGGEVWNNLLLPSKINNYLHPVINS
jgi:hypothetical protein